MGRRRERERAREAVARKLEQLRSLADRPREQARFALELVAKERDIGLINAATATLADVADASTRPGLHRVYADLNADPTKRDPGCHTRAALLRALRPILTPEDGDLLGRACATYEELPTGGGMEEVAHGLRGLALVMLAETDETLASFHAARLLVDPRTHPMSGEPAATAARVLAAQGQLLPLYGYALGGGHLSEVIAECLRGLVDVPGPLLPDLIAEHLASEDETVLLGLFDLLLAERHRGVGVRIALDFIRSAGQLDMVRYLATTLVVSRDESVIQRLEDLVWELDDGAKARLIGEALDLR
jgi:hypothetical protein